MKNLVNKRPKKTIKFMGEDLEIKKLSVAEVLAIQEKAKELENDQTGGLTLLKEVIKASVEEAKELSDEDFKSFAMDDLTKLSNEIMKFSGMDAQGK